MDRVYMQVKRIINNIDLNKIYSGFNKFDFLIRKNHYLYGLNNELLSDLKETIIIDKKTYLIYDTLDNESIKDIVIGVVLKMFDYSYKTKSFNKEKLMYTRIYKDNEYYIKKYQLNLLIVNVLKNNTSFIEKCNYLIEERKKQNEIVDLEINLESNVGLKKYIKIKLYEMFKPEEYNFELRMLFETLEDPCLLLNYINNVENYSAAYLLCKNKINTNKLKNEVLDLDKPLFSFEKLILENEKKIKKILMYKMIHAKKIYTKGVIINCDFNKMKFSDNLFYFPGQITIYYNNKEITKKGDFILKLNDAFEIEEGYECFSIDKVLA